MQASEAQIRCLPEKGAKPFSIRYEGDDRTFTLATDRIEAALVSEMPDALQDLLELACSVLAADSEFTRGSDLRSAMGQTWSRNLSFTIPVRRLDLWSRPEVRSALVDAVEFLTDDRVHFEFIQKEATAGRVDFLPFQPSQSPFHAHDVILFSGGLDSFAGALETLATTDGKVVLVTHRSAQKVIPRQEDLGSYLKDRFPGRVLHIQVQAVRKGHEGKETTQRSRSLLFASLGYAVAQMLGASRVSFFENGVVSHNLPISPQVIGTMATRTTHPLSLNLLERLLHLVSDRPIPLHNEFEWLTKKEVVEKIARHGAVDRITRAVSCTRIRDQDRLKTHCGQCSQCLDRRFAILGAGLEPFDDRSHYHVDVLRGDRETDHSRTMALDWTRHAWRLTGMEIDDFYRTYSSDLSRIGVGHPELGAGEVVRLAFEMQRRHAANVATVLQLNASSIFDDQVPATSLLKMFGGEQARSGGCLPIPEIEMNVAVKTAETDAEAQSFTVDRLEVAFYATSDGRKCCEVVGLGSVSGAMAEIPHALKPFFEEDRDSGILPNEFRYLLVYDLELSCDLSKNSAHQLVSRCRRAFGDFYQAIYDSELPNQFLLQNKPSRGYRLDPTLRIVGMHQAGRS